ncbi:sperm acrosome membrane-associated protein 4-like [Rhinichthys klamathensis goyatoka]|uniref:sperm acrosome membrane-associated protein 4-like n=1 Tax=Rhinichthys klamathensis goyatoka TaxID=3034132 RepID=UPI0024B60A83|nr:sperm acrosome membrane-associated protein 4-like [Rhinichthys klamathensis goyatoka]
MAAFTFMGSSTSKTHLNMRGNILTASVILMSLFFLGQTLECFRCDLGFWDLCYTTKTNCSENELCYVGTGKAASVLDIKVMGCLPMEACNMTTYVEFLTNKTLYTMKTTCCEEDFCNSAPAVQLSIAPLLLTILLLAQMMGVF